MADKQRAYAALLLVAATVAAYFDALGCGFVLDDYHYVLEHRDLGVRLIPSLFWRAYESGNAAFYRPLATATFALDRSLAGLSATWFHAVNVAWHAAATLALASLLARVTSRRAAFAAALLFAVHPIHTEAVTGIVGRTEVMAALFVFVGCALFLDGKSGWAALAYLAALMCKESGVTLPLLALLFDRSKWRRAWPFAVALAIYVALRVHALAGATLPAPAEYFAAATPWQSFVTAVDVLGRELALLVWPHPLVADYSYPALPIASYAHAAFTVAAIAILARVRALRLPLAWFVVAILPVSNLIVHIGVVMAERLLYLPSVAVCLAAGAAWDALAARVRPYHARNALAAVAVALAALTLSRNLDWQTPLSLWRDTVAKQPRSALAHGNLALSCVVVGDRACARAELETAVALDPRRADFERALDQLVAQPE